MATGTVTPPLGYTLDKPVSVDDRDVDLAAAPKLPSIDDGDLDLPVEKRETAPNAVTPKPISQVAGAAGPLPSVPRRPQVDMGAPSVGQTLTGANPKAAKPTQKFDGGGEGTDLALEGMKQMGNAWGTDNHFNSTDAKQGLTKLANGVMGAAGSTIIGGSGKGLVDAAGATGLLGRAGPMAARALAAAIVGGYITGKAARWGAKELGLDPDSQDLSEALGNIAGGTIAAHVSAPHPEGLHPDYHAIPEVEAQDIDEPMPEEPKQLKAPKPEPDTHPAGKVTAYAEDGLPIVDRGKPSEEAEEPAKPMLKATKTEGETRPSTPAKEGEILPPEKKSAPAAEEKKGPPTLEAKSSEKPVKAGVLSPEQDGEVVGAVVPSTPVPVVNDLGGKDGAAQPALGSGSVDKNLAPVTGNNRVAVPPQVREATLQDALTGGGTGLATEAPARAHADNTPANNAGNAGKVATTGTSAPVAPEGAKLGRPTGVDLPGDKVDATELANEAVDSRHGMGTEDKKSGRTLLQPGSTIKANQELATAGLKEILPSLKETISGVPGAELAGVREEKDADRTKEKIEDEKKPASTIPDYGALRISVDSPQAKDDVVRLLRDKFPVVREKNEFENGSPAEKFPAHMLQLQSSNGASIEAQILPKEVAAIAEDTHDLYAKSRDGDKDAQQELKLQNAAAMEAFNARNAHQPETGKLAPATTGTSAKRDERESVQGEAAPGPMAHIRPEGAGLALAKGTHVALPDGRSGTVDFYDGKVTKNARVTADDGEKLQSVPGKSLTPVTVQPQKPDEPWVGVDLDRTLAKYTTFQGPTVIGKPIPAMVDRIKQHIADGDNVRIVTARVSKDPNGKIARAIQAWSQKNLGTALPVTDKKDERMTRLYDDKAVAVEPNTGKILGGGEEPQSSATAKPEEVQQPAEITAGEVGQMPVKSLALDPKRFQYKLNTDTTGVTNLLKGRRWNPDLAGIISVWKDPANGKFFVVNGHHRFQLAKENGVKSIAVRVLEAKDAGEARSIGALQNIAEGRGTPVDAAKFFRETSITPEDLDKQGISLGEATAANGLALSKLDNRLFDDVVSGKLRQGRAIAIGNATEVPEQQEAILKLIQRKELGGRQVPDDVVAELGRMAKSAGEHTETQVNLFGLQEMKRNLALEKAEVSAYIRRQIGQEKRLFSGVADENKAQQLSKTGNKINAAENARVAEEAAQAQELYDRLSTRAGELDEILNQSASSLAKGRDPGVVKSAAYEDARAYLSQALGRGKDASAEGLQEDAGGPAAAQPAAGSEPALPGFERAVAEQRDAAAEERGSQLTEDLQRPKGDIEKAAGEMERNSPLFEGSSANPQGSMFRSGFLDPELFKTLFPDIAGRVREWLADDVTPGDEQREMMRQTRGEMDRRVAAVAHKLEPVRKGWMLRSRADSMAFWNGVEDGNIASLPGKDQALAKTFKGGFDQMKADLQQLKPEVLKNYIENYFPHIWERPSQARKILHQVLTGKRPFAGRASFLKQRTVPTMQDGIDMGLVPKSWNPVDQFLTKYSEMAQFLMGHQTLAMMKEAGTARFVRVFDKAPEGWRQIDDRIGTVYGDPTIPISEAFDKRVYSAIMETAHNLLTATTRKANIGGTRLGYYSLLDGIVTKTGTPLDVMAHELGHAIDEIYGLKQQLVKDPRFKTELRDLADMRFEGENPSAYYKKYVRKGEEKMAAIFQAYVHTPERFQEVAPNTYKHILDFLGQHAELKPLKDLKKSMVHEVREDTVNAGGMVIRGYYYAPPDAAQAFNNFVSRGLAGRSGIYDTLSWANNNMNALQLGISAFHATTTSVNAATSEVALGIKQLSEGKPVKAAGHILSGATTVPSIVRTMVNGSRLMREYLSPGSYAKMAREASAIAESGGRIKQNTLELKPFQKMVNAFRNGAIGEGLSSIPGTILHATVAPVMEYWVPRMKLGAFYDMAHDVLDQAQKHGWEAEEIRRRMQKAWDSADDRFGQMVYDNLFWHKIMQNALQLGVRSVGWNFGDVRQLGGGAMDTIKEANKALHGEAPEVTDRMAFAFALPLYTALVGAVLTYLWTGEKPDTWKDYFYPKRKDGTRVSIPGYMKDVVAFREHPVGTVENKLAPIWQMTGEAINNRDFYGTEIRHQDDNPVKQFGEFAAWVARSATPFAFAGTQKLLENKGEDASFDWHHPIDSAKKIGGAIARHPGDLAMGNTGFQPAPAYIQNSAALNMARDYEHSNYTPGTKTQAQADYTKHMHAVEDAYRTKNPNREAIVKQMVKDGKLSEAGVFKAQMKSTENPLVIAVRSLSIEQALNVYEAASPEERKAIGVQVERKAAGIETDPRLSQEKRDELQESYKRLFGFGTPSKRASIKGAGGS